MRGDPRAIMKGDAAAAVSEMAAIPLVGEGEDIPPSVEDQYNEISGGQERVTIESLMKIAGVTPEDIQIVANDRPEIVSKIGGGNTCETSAREATRRGGTAQGRCGAGSRDIFNSAGGMARDSISCPAAYAARDEYRRDYPFKGKDPGGDSFYIGLEASGNYISIDVPNQAYGKQKRGLEDSNMNMYMRSISPGASISLDCVFDRNIPAASTAGGKWGHVAVKRNDGCFQCDGRQEWINCARYGPKIHVSFPKDAFVPKEYALAILQQAQQRMSDPNYQYPDGVRQRKAVQAGRPKTQQRAQSGQRSGAVGKPRQTTTSTRRPVASRARSR